MTGDNCNGITSKQLYIHKHRYCTYDKWYYAKRDWKLVFILLSSWTYPFYINPSPSLVCRILCQLCDSKPNSSEKGAAANLWIFIRAVNTSGWALYTNYQNTQYTHTLYHFHPIWALHVVFMHGETQCYLKHRVQWGLSNNILLHTQATMLMSISHTLLCRQHNRWVSSKATEVVPL